MCQEGVKFGLSECLLGCVKSVCSDGVLRGCVKRVCQEGVLRGCVKRVCSEGVF